MDKQQILDLYYQSANNGTFPAFAEVSCRYRILDAIPIRKCAIGVLIPDEEYCPAMEDTGSMQSLLHKYSYLKGILPECLSGQEYESIQNCHDQNADPYLRMKMCPSSGKTLLNQWDRTKFLKELLRLNCFKGMKYTADPTITGYDDA